MKAKAFPDLRKKPTPEQLAARLAKVAEREREIKMCLSKRAYASREDAQTAIAYQRGRLNAPSILRLYECPYCEMWHMTRLIP
jgi:hypothetical protein